MSWEKFTGLGYGWVVAQVTINFKRPLKMGDKIKVRTGILEMNEKGSKVQFEIINVVSGKVSSDGIFDYVMIDLSTQRSCKVTPEMIEAYSI
ncbi:Acyl-ACP thioesterase [compost metagenome]